MLKKQKKSDNSGFTLIEVLIAISLVAFSMIAILGIFIYQGKQNNSVNDRNIAVMLAEERIEEYFKFPRTDMPDGVTDYIVYDLNRDPVYMSSRTNAVKNGIVFERVVTITPEDETTLIQVEVGFGYNLKTDKFDFGVSLQTRKGGL